MATDTIDKALVKQVAKATGWMQFKAKRELEAAKALGISPKQYLKRRCWEMSDEDLKALGERLERRRQIREEQASELSELTGWSSNEATRKIREAKNAGLTFRQYINRKGYELADEELPRLSAAIKATKRRREENRAFMVDAIIKKSGWTKTYVEKRLDEAKEQGINVFNYFSNSCWAKNDQELADCASMCQGFHENAEGKREKCLNYIREQTGWNEGEITLHTLEALADSGSSVEDYARCHMWDMDPEVQRTFLNSAVFRKFRMAYDDFQVGSPIFDYKDTFEEVFSDLIERRHFSFDGMGKGEFFDAIKGLKSIVVKPARGSYGRDIEILPCNESYLQNGELYEKLVKIGKPLVIEEKIEQCEVLDKLCPSSVNTLRVVTLREDDQTHILQCVLRCGVGAVVDNIHSGGLVIEVDPDTGECLGDAVDYFGNLIEEHPITGVKFKGLKVPNLAEVISLVEEASKVVPECRLIGWDVAVTKEGADLVEGNLKADYDAGQMAHLGVAREGLRQTMVAPYVHPDVLGHSYLKDIAMEAEDADGINSSDIKISVIMPVYNAEEYINEAVESVLNQSIGFAENIQLILVNDGSTDGSADICKKYFEDYPENVEYIEKKNGGPSSARNAGLPYATGAFVNFMDADDKWSLDAFENVWKFIGKHKGEIDVVGCRLKYFEGKTGYHQLDYKFKEGDRVIDIVENPDFVQMNVTSAFIARTAFTDRSFDERISLGEDAKLLTEVILEKRRYGVVKSAVCHYRKREVDSSLTQTKHDKKESFIETVKHYYTFIADYSVEKFGRIVPYVQHCLVNGLKYRAGKPLPEVLDSDEAKFYRKRVIDLLSRLDDGIILEARNASPSLRLYMLHLKNGIPVKRMAHEEDGYAWVNNGRAFKITGNGDVCLKDLEFSEEKVLLKGIARIPSFVFSYGLFCEVAGSVIEATFDREDPEPKIGITDETISEKVPFTFEIPPSESGFELRMYASYEDDVVNIPISIDAQSDLAEAKKGGSFIDGYLVKRPDRYLLSVKKS